MSARHNSLHLHHIFVLTSVGAPEAQALVDAGLLEGSPNTHPGQGTANRRFFFESGFLELLWVHDEREAQSPITAPTKLFDRWAGRGRTANPFGLCFSSADGADSNLPFPSWPYRPDYLLDGRCMFFADQLLLSEPEVFVPSWPQVPSSPITEPTRHPLGLRKMLSVSVGLPDPASVSSSMRAIRDAGLIRVHHSASPELVIEFTSQEEVQHRVPALGLSLVGRQTAPLNS
jgi:Glyoxalase-like domain